MNAARTSAGSRMRCCVGSRNPADRARKTPGRGARAAHRARDARAARAGSAPTAIGCFELEADATIPAEYVLLRHYPRRAGRPGARGEDRRLSAPHPGRAWRLAAVPRRRVRHERQRQGLFRAEDDRRRRPTRRTCAARARRSWRAAARRRATCSPASLLALFGEVPWRAVPVMPVEIMLLPRWFPFHLDEDLVLGAHRARAAAGAAGAEAARAQSARRRHRRAVRRSRRSSVRPVAEGAAPDMAVVRRSSAASTRCCALVEPLFPKRLRAARDRQRPSPSSTERLNGEDGLGAIFPAMANSVMMFDALGYPPRRPAARDRARRRSRSCSSSRTTRPIASPASRRCGTRRSPATRCSRSGGAEADGGRARGPRLAEAAAGARRRGRLDRAAARRAARRLGVPVRQPALSRSRRHRGRGDGDGPRQRAAASRRVRRRRSTRGARMGRGPAEQRTAAGAPSTPTTATTTSTTSRSPITARCSIRRPRT